MMNKTKIAKLLAFIIAGSLAAITALFLYTTYSYYRTVDTLADTVTATVRTEILSGDNRSAITHLNIPLRSIFYKITYESYLNDQSFELERESIPQMLFLSGSIEKNIFSDRESQYRAGRINFYFDYNNIILSYAIIACLIIIGSIAIYYSGRKKIERDFQLQIQLRKKELLSTLSTQLAHDIRSPLATLDAIYEDLETLPSSSKKLIQSSIARIHGIADGLLNKARTHQFEQLELVPFSPHESILEIIEEKKYQFRQKQKLSIKSQLCSSSRKIEGDKIELMRIISNLINNSVEAMKDEGEIEIASSIDDQHFVIEVRDTGPGMPQSIIERLGVKGATEGKEKGNGLGLYHAHSTMKQWGAELSVLSSSAGTTVVLRFPLVLENSAAKIHMVLLDNDPLVRMNWKWLAQKDQINLVIFEQSKDLLNALDQIEKDTPIYLDDELGEELSGVDLASILSAKGHTQLHLTTGHPPEQFAHLSFLRSVIGKAFPRPFNP